MKKILFVVLVASLFALVGFTMFNDAIPVLTYDEVVNHAGKFQIKGTPINDKNSYDSESQLFSFYLNDDNGKEFLVKYSGIKPGNYEEAQEVIAIGYYNSEGFIDAKRIMVKCPSKYQAEGGEGFEYKEY